MQTTMTDVPILDLARARDAVVTVHGELLALAQREYEREHGRVDSGLALLQLIAEDPAFAWLRPLTALVATVDEHLNDPQPEMGARSRVLLHALRDLLRANEAGGDFQRRYFAAIQTSPEIAVAHGRAVRSLQTEPSGTLN